MASKTSRCDGRICGQLLWLLGEESGVVSHASRRREFGWRSRARVNRGTEQSGLELGGLEQEGTTTKGTRSPSARGRREGRVVGVVLTGGSRPRCFPRGCKLGLVVLVVYAVGVDAASVTKHLFAQSRHWIVDTRSSCGCRGHHLSTHMSSTEYRVHINTSCRATPVAD